MLRTQVRFEGIARPRVPVSAAVVAPAPAPLPPRPDFAVKADRIGIGGPKQRPRPLRPPSHKHWRARTEISLRTGKGRLANMSAAETEMASLVPVKASQSSATSSFTATSSTTLATSVTMMNIRPATAPPAPGRVVSGPCKRSRRRAATPWLKTGGDGGRSVRWPMRSWS